MPFIKINCPRVLLHHSDFNFVQASLLRQLNAVFEQSPAYASSLALRGLQCSFLEQYQSIVHFNSRESEPVLYPSHRSILIKEHMRRILFIVPAFEAQVLLIQVCHAVEDSSGIQQILEGLEFLMRVVKVLDDFTAHDIVVSMIQGFRVIVEKRIVQLDIEFPFSKHRGDYRARTRTEIEASIRGAVPRQYRIDNRRNKSAVPLVIDVVMVMKVAFLLFRRAQSIAFAQVDPEAIAAEVIHPVFGCIE